MSSTRSPRGKSPANDLSNPLSQNFSRQYNKFQKRSSTIRSYTGRPPSLIIIRKEETDHHYPQFHRNPHPVSILKRKEVEEEQVALIESGSSTSTISEVNLNLNKRSKTVLKAIKSLSSHILGPRESISKINEEQTPMRTTLSECFEIDKHDNVEECCKNDNKKEKYCKCPRRISFKFSSKKTQVPRKKLVDKGSNYHLKTVTCGTQYKNLTKVTDTYTSPGSTHDIKPHRGTLTETDNEDRTGPP